MKANKLNLTLSCITKPPAQRRLRPEDHELETSLGFLRKTTIPHNFHSLSEPGVSTVSFCLSHPLFPRHPGQTFFFMSLSLFPSLSCSINTGRNHLLLNFIKAKSRPYVQLQFEWVFHCSLLNNTSDPCLHACNQDIGKNKYQQEILGNKLAC